jgi:hypothetical protein
MFSTYLANRIKWLMRSRALILYLPAVISPISLSLVLHPLNLCWGGAVMTKKSSRPRCPYREAWTHECLVREHAIAIACAVEPGSSTSYSSAVKSYFDFCTLHSLSVELTPDTHRLHGPLHQA